ncbi:MAG: hypothetical protein ABI867_32160 [Kofleriaceae bacterium]
MLKTITLAVALVLAASGSASAGGKEGSIGVGAEFGINGEAGGISMNYDAGKFHFGGFLALIDGGGDNDTDFTFGGRFYYHIHSTAMADFGIGGGFGFFSEDNVDDMINGGDRIQRFYLEPSFQIRVFPGVANVALSFTAGISIGLVDADEFRLDAQGAAPVALGGVHYYFF